MERGRKGLKSKARDESCPRASALLSPVQTCRISALRWQPDVVLSPSLQHWRFSAREGFVPAARQGEERVFTSCKAPRLSLTRGLLTAAAGATRARSAGEFMVPQTVPRASPGLSLGAAGRTRQKLGQDWF